MADSFANENNNISISCGLVWIRNRKRRAESSIPFGSAMAAVFLVGHSNAFQEGEAAWSVPISSAQHLVFRK